VAQPTVAVIARGGTEIGIVDARPQSVEQIPVDAFGDPTTPIEQVTALPALRGLRFEVFEDLHRGGKNTQRPGLERLREHVHSDDVALFGRVVDVTEALRLKNAAHRGLRYSRTTRYALTGLLRCDRCGDTVHGTTNRSHYVYYVCRARYASRACSQPVARADSVEDQMRNWLAAIRLPPGFAETFAKTMRADRNGHGRRTERDVEKQRKAIDARIARLQELSSSATSREATTSRAERL
jgi:hypothetical protein